MTQSDLTSAPREVRITMVGAIRVAQQGGKSDSATPTHGDLRDVMEVSETDESGTYRHMYTTKIGDHIFVLDFFQKISKSGIATPQADLNRILLRPQEST